MGTIVLADITEIETIKISELPESTTVFETDILPMVTSNVTKKMSKANFVKDDFSTTSRIVFVGKDGSDSNPGTIHYPFLTIQAAIDYAYTTYSGDLSIENQVIIKISPGKYEEQIHSYLGITLAGVLDGKTAITGRAPITLYNTGLDESHYPLRSNGDEHFVMIGVNIETNYHGIYGKLPKGNLQNCRFRLGDFIERDDTGTAYCAFNGCYFEGGDHNGFYFTGTDLTNICNIRIKDSEMRYSWPSALPVFQSTHTGGWSQIAFFNTRMRTSFTVEGDWMFNARDSYLFTSTARNTFDTINEVEIINTEISNGLHFKSQPSELTIVNCNYGTEVYGLIPDGEADITADVDIICDIYCNNVQHNGLSGKIKFPKSDKSVGRCGINSYLTLQDAIDGVLVSEEGVILLSGDISDLAELTITGAKTITIDGKRAWSLEFTNDIVEIGLNQKMIFSKVKDINGEIIEINGDNAELHIHDCNHTSEYSILLTSGIDAHVHINSSNYMAPVGLSAIQINSNEPDMTVEYSRLSGAVGQPAIKYTVESNNNLRAKFSTFFHGDGGGNYPIISTAAKCIIAMYNCGLNAAWSPSQIDNSIGQANNTTDPDINF